jgi:peptidoglycan/LPS O-acetylase OafA/YrhL
MTKSQSLNNSDPTLYTIPGSSGEGSDVGYRANDIGNRPHVPVLDGFRGLAILMVTLYRFAEVSLSAEVISNLPSKAILIGAAGVDFFFVLSGFLITGILLEAKGNDTRYFTNFYARRSLRIFPLYFLSLAQFSSSRFHHWFPSAPMAIHVQSQHGLAQRLVLRQSESLLVASHRRAVLFGLATSSLSNLQSSFTARLHGCSAVLR